MPSSIRSILLKTCLKPGFRPGFRHVLSRFQTCRRQVRDQKSRGHVSDLIDLSQHVDIDLAGLRRVRVFFLLKAGFEQDRSSGI